MTSRDAMQDKLVELLAAANFDTKYYAFHDTHAAEGKAKSTLDQKAFASALESTGLSFTYHASGKYFEHADATTRLKVSFTQGTAEFILGADTPGGAVGGPFAKLAASAAKSKDPKFAHTPPYPKLPFSDASELAEVVTFGVSLYNEAKAAITKYDGWNS